MLINRDAKPWIVLSVVLFVAATAAYIPYHMASQPYGPSGGTWPGLIFGIVGTLMIFFAMALTPRKKLRTLRVGRAYLWMQGHVWFGLLSFPVILYHAGFREGLWGGLITWTLMILFILIEVSGIVGLIMQNLLPSKLLRDVRFETIFDQIDHVIGQLRDEASKRVEALTAHREEAEYDYDAIPVGAATAVMARPSVAKPGAATVQAFYKTTLEQYLTPAGRSSTLASPDVAAAAFDKLRAATPVDVHETINDLQSIAEERRQLSQQKRLHTFLHAWLWVHIPLSLAMLVLILVHIVVALKYVQPW